MVLRYFGCSQLAVAITPFKVIQGHRFWYKSQAPICDFLIVINTNLPFPSYGRLVVKFSLSIDWWFTWKPPLGVIPYEYPDKLYLSRN